MNWRCMSMIFKAVLVSILLQTTLSFDIFEDGKHQGLVPVSRLGRGDYWTIVEEKKQGGGMMPYPRLGRKIFKLPQTLIPYPRAGRDTFESVNDLYDLMYPDYVFAGPEDPWTDIQFDSFPLVEKRRNIKLIPRIGRKKRSVSDSENEHEGNSKINDNDMRDSEATERIWNELDDIDRDYYKRSDRQSARSRNSFVPRVGKKDADDEFLFESKRKMLFTPRIGRASLIPRIGRNDPRFKVKSRGAFIPRIGRASAFVPRIGRSESHQPNSTPII